MVKRLAIVVVLTVAAGAALGLPRGLSGATVGFGGLLGDMGFVGGELDYAKPPYIGWGPEVMLAFGGGVAVFAGAEGRVYIIPNYNYLAQPYFEFGGGFAAAFASGDGGQGKATGNDTHIGGYLHFGAGNDFDIPDTKIVPFIDLGGQVMISDVTSTVFKLEVGVRFDTW